MPEREDLHAFAPLTTHQQEQESEDVTEDEVEEGREHNQPGWPLPHRAQAINLQVGAAPTQFPHPTGNSGAQIAADLTRHAQMTWATSRPPRFLADDIDGRALFDAATARRHALDNGHPDTGGVTALGDIVAVPPVRTARDAGLLPAVPMFTRLTADGPAWPDGTTTHADAVIWSTGFRPALTHLAPLALRDRSGHIPTEGTRALTEPRLHLLGYGDWTGPASATLIGVGRTARDAADQIAELLA